MSSHEVKNYILYLGITAFLFHLAISPIGTWTNCIGWILLSLTVIYLRLLAIKGHIALTVVFGYLLDIFGSPRIGLYLTGYLILLWPIPKLKKRLVWQSIWGCFTLSILLLALIQIWITFLMLFLNTTHLNLVSLQSIVIQSLIGAIISPVLFKFYDMISGKFVHV